MSPLKKKTQKPLHTTSLWTVGSVNFSSIASTSETVFRWKRISWGSTATVFPSRCVRSDCIIFPWTLCVFLISSRRDRRRIKMPSLYVELLVPCWSLRSGVTVEGVEGGGDWINGRMLSNWGASGWWISGTGGSKGTLDSGRSCPAPSDSSSELDRDTGLKMHKMWSIIIWLYKVQFRAVYVK